MKRLINYLSIFILLINSHFVLGQTVDDFINKSNKFYQSGNLKEAAQVMEEAIEKFPEYSTAYSYLGFYRGMQAGETQNFMEAGQLIGTAYQHLDKAVELDPNNPIARFHRGVMGVNVPAFLSKLDGGIKDLEFLVKLYQQSPDQLSPDFMARCYDFLGKGYHKKEKSQEAVTAWKKVIELAPETDLAINAQKNVDGLSSTQKEETTSKSDDEILEKKYFLKDIDLLKKKIDGDPNNISLQIELSRAFMDNEKNEKAQEVLENVIQKDSTNIAAYKLVMEAVGKIAEKGYDENIYTDTSYRTKLAFKVSELAERAVAIAPDDLELRLIRGNIDVSMPFFVGKLEQGIEDLNFIIHSKADQEIKAEATYWLGVAYQKKAITNWIKVISKYPGTNASQLAFQSMRPSVEHFDASAYEKPFLAIDFIMGFRDELAPQTVIWIEDQNENFIKTVYVSGFSGFAKEKQVNLPEWSDASYFSDVDAVTAASIDVGHHIYVWDLKDHKGNRVKNGEYRVNIEVAFWPSMEYQMVSVPITISSDSKKNVIEEGNLIPYVEVRYYGDDQ